MGMFENNDYLMRQIEDMTEAMGKMLFQKQSSSTGELFDKDGMVSETGFLTYRLNRLVEQNKINEAENLLFDELDGQPKPEYLRMALNFYTSLSKKSDEALKAADFSRNEIADGLDKVKKIYKL